MIKTLEELPAVISSPLGATVLGISEQTFRALCRAGEIPAVHIGRRWVVPKERFVSFLNSGGHNDD